MKGWKFGWDKRNKQKLLEDNSLLFAASITEIIWASSKFEKTQEVDA